MKIVRTVGELRDALATARTAAAARSAGTAGSVGSARRGGVGFVPTMGALHEGHLSLVAAAREQHDAVVLSIFVNPKQFNEAADLAAYPRDERRDAELAASAGVDIVFAPAASELYPEGFATNVHVSGPITETLEGANRGAEHFDGVATVVAKLLIAVGPEAAYFGQKDAQQVVVVRRMAADLGIPARIVACPTSRDPDGLARSSRNTRLTRAERARALAIPRALDAIAEAHGAGETETAALHSIGERTLEAADVTAEYLAFVDPGSLEEVPIVTGPTLCAVAARVGDVRLIDNVLLGAEPPQREGN